MFTKIKQVLRITNNCYLSRQYSFSQHEERMFNTSRELMLTQ